MRCVNIAHQDLAQMQPLMAHCLLRSGQWLQALACAHAKPREIAIVGSPGDEATRARLGAATSGFRPHQVVAYGPAGVAAPAPPLLKARALVDGQGERARPTAYVCQGFACQAPVTEVEALKTQRERE